MLRMFQCLLTFTLLSDLAHSPLSQFEGRPVVDIHGKSLA